MRQTKTMIMREIIKQQTKTLDVRTNNRSSNFITPNFISSCNAGCSYCYTYRLKDKIYINTNTTEILKSIYDHSISIGNKLNVDQCDDKYWVYDIGCNTDIVYHWKDYNWLRVFNLFDKLDNAKLSFATKFVNYKLLKYGSEKKRIRFSLMPQSIADIVEMNTTSISKRIEAIDRFIEAGWDVHINFSPVIYYDNWIADYTLLMQELNQKVKNKDLVKAEVIFLTHHKGLHNKNLIDGLQEQEKVLYKPEIQECKKSEYGTINLRYELEFKKKLIEDYIKLHSSIIPWCKIRYIF